MKERVKELRKQLGLTLEEFGNRLGVTKTTISRIENGRNAITDQMKMSICREFNVNSSWLVDGVGEMFFLTEVRNLQIFDSFLKSLGYVIDIDYDEVNEYHMEDVTDNEGKVIGQTRVVDDATYLYHLTKHGKKTTFTEEEFNNFQREIENSVNYEIWKKQNNN